MKYVGFLRGINVGGHHKVPMAELRAIFITLGFSNFKTLLNSGNIVFDADTENITEIENKIEIFISEAFGFSIPVIILRHNEIADLVIQNPFKNIEMHQDIRLYVSLLKQSADGKIKLPYSSPDHSYKIITIKNQMVCSVLNLSLTKTPKAMEALEIIFGKNITTRNWNTLKKVVEI